MRFVMERRNASFCGLYQFFISPIITSQKSANKQKHSIFIYKGIVPKVILLSILTNRILYIISRFHYPWCPNVEIMLTNKLIHLL